MYFATNLLKCFGNKILCCWPSNRTSMIILQYHIWTEKTKKMQY